MLSYTDIKQTIAPELLRFEELFEQSLRTHVPLADNVVRYFLDRRGKQLRPVITILAAKMLRGQVPEATLYGAVALELLHNASLMHDDVVDRSDERRGRASVNRVWDNRVAVLMGDFFLAKCLASSNETGMIRVSQALAEMVTRLAEGELEQLANMRARLMSEERYFNVISGKTASLFAACMKVGAYTVDASPDECARMAEVGERMGLVFQIRDDIFDYFPATADVGKPTGHDILEGKISLPLLYAFRHASSAESSRMQALLAGNRELTPDEANRLVEFAKAVGGIDYARARMKNIAFEARQILETFPDSEARQSLAALLDYMIERDH